MSDDGNISFKMCTNVAQLSLSNDTGFAITSIRCCEICKAYKVKPNQCFNLIGSCTRFLLREKCKSAMMQYRSELLRVIETLVFSPLLLSGHMSEKQYLMIEFFTNFLDDPMNPLNTIDIQIRSR